MNPSTHKKAATQADLLMRNRLRGLSHQTKWRRARYAAILAEKVWRHWKVGIYRWQFKHAVWAISEGTRHLGSHARYQYWLSLRDLLPLLGKNHWIPALTGPWQSPVSSTDN